MPIFIKTEDEVYCTDDNQLMEPCPGGYKCPICGIKVTFREILTLEDYDEDCPWEDLGT